jgi:hypothetical protein
MAVMRASTPVLALHSVWTGRDSFEAVRIYVLESQVATPAVCEMPGRDADSADRRL